MIGETVLEINLKSLAHNFEYLKSKIKSSTKVMGVVKAFAYGSEAGEVALKLQELGIDFFAVAYTNEGVKLREVGVTQPILVLHPQSMHFETLMQNCLTPSIYSKFVLDHFIASAEAHKQKNYPIHLKLNTGFNRLGFANQELDGVIEKLKTTKAVQVEGVYSHLAASEDLKEKEFSLSQIKNYEAMSSQLIHQLGYKPLKHLCNTSGILNYPEAHHDMVRTGIGLHGYSNDFAVDAALKPIATLKTIISQIHEVQPGESVGYNRKFIAEKFTKTATIPLGHADGINRIYGKGKNYVSIKGEKAPIIGNVCMDMIMVDVTHINCKEGDEVIVFGPELSAEVFANLAGSISYELITSVSQRIKRKIIN